MDNVSSFTSSRESFETLSRLDDIEQSAQDNTVARLRRTTLSAQKAIKSQAREWTLTVRRLKAGGMLYATPVEKLDPNDDVGPSLLGSQAQRRAISQNQSHMNGTTTLPQKPHGLLSRTLADLDSDKEDSVEFENVSLVSDSISSFPADERSSSSKTRTEYLLGKLKRATRRSLASSRDAILSAKQSIQITEIPVAMRVARDRSVEAFKASKSVLAETANKISDFFADS